MEFTQAQQDTSALSNRVRQRGPSGEEELRFIRNFHDIFLSIGLAMLIVGMVIVSALISNDVFQQFFVGDFEDDFATASKSAFALQVLLPALTR